MGGVIIEQKGYTMAKQIGVGRRSALYIPSIRTLFSYQMQGETHKLGSFTRKTILEKVNYSGEIN